MQPTTSPWQQGNERHFCFIEGGWKRPADLAGDLKDCLFPMDEAPRDGSAVLLLEKDGAAHVASWAQLDGMDGPDWVVYWERYSAVFTARPVSWMPLPCGSKHLR